VAVDTPGWPAMAVCCGGGVGRGAVRPVY